MQSISNLLDDLDTDGIEKMTLQVGGPHDDGQRYDALIAAKTAIELAHSLIRWATERTTHENSAEGYVLNWLADIHGDMAGATGHHAVTVADLAERFSPDNPTEDDEEEDAE